MRKLAKSIRKIVVRSPRHSTSYRSSLVGVDTAQETLRNQVVDAVVCIILRSLARLTKPRRDWTCEDLERVHNLVPEVVVRRRSRLVRHAQALRRDCALLVRRALGREERAVLGAKAVEPRTLGQCDVPRKRGAGGRELEAKQRRVVERLGGVVVLRAQELAGAEPAEAHVPYEQLADGWEHWEDDGPETDVATDPARVSSLIGARAVIRADGVRACLKVHLARCQLSRQQKHSERTHLPRNHRTRHSTEHGEQSKRNCGELHRWP